MVIFRSIDEIWYDIFVDKKICMQLQYTEIWTIYSTSEWNEIYSHLRMCYLIEKIRVEWTKIIGENKTRIRCIWNNEFCNLIRLFSGKNNSREWMNIWIWTLALICLNLIADYLFQIVIKCRGNTPRRRILNPRSWQPLRSPTTHSSHRRH